jgi:hypothetical protein
MEVIKCSHTGLLYVNGVAFTKERIKAVFDLMNYGLKNKGQFNYTILIEDTANEAEIRIDKDNINELMSAVIDYVDIANDEDFG